MTYKIKTVYIADDGTQFDNEEEAYYYVMKHNYPELFKIKFYNEDWGLFYLDEKDYFNSDVFEYCDAVEIKDEKELKALHWFSQTFGPIEFYKYINSPGFWIGSWMRGDTENIYFIKEADKI